MRPAWLLASFGALTLLCLNSWSVEIIAHRGASHDAPENTLAAIRLGWEQNADAVEIDVHRTRDGHLVAMHDPTAARTAGVDRKIADLTLNELKALEAGYWKAPTWKGEKIPTLESILAALPESRKLVIEVKEGPEVIPGLVETLKSSRKDLRRIVVISFSFETAHAAREQLPDSEVFGLAGYDESKIASGESPGLDQLIDRAVASRLTGLNLSHKWPIDRAFIDRVKRAGLRLFVWTVDDPVRARELLAAGVEGITTNRPGWLREQLGMR